MIVTLPKPPSINHIYAYTSRGKFARSYITKRGKDWFLSASQSIKEQVGIPIPNSAIVEVSIKLYTCRMQDLDNITKPILDLLAVVCAECQEKVGRRKSCKCGAKHTVLEDDSQVYKIVSEKFKVKTVSEEKVVVGVRLMVGPEGMD